MDDTKAICIIALKDSNDGNRVRSKCFLSAATVRGYREIFNGQKN